MHICKFCNKECKNPNSLRNHERLCKSNPNRQQSPFENLTIQQTKKKSNQFISGKQTAHSDETKLKISKAASKQVKSDETKRKLSIAAKKNGLGGHTSKRRIFFEKNDGTTVYLQSSYEIEFATILEELGIEWSRPDPFIWLDENNEEHRYYPDFKVGNVYIDTKNDYLAVYDLPKINTVREQNNIDLRIVTKEMINKEFIASLV